ncbi:MAG: hypothetical protein JW806_07065, partial [Sedimentisphaerales bacterium]|nr:hypothetical protein [Sedimentisphaerales bacterium]
EYWLSPFDFSEFTDFARQWKREVDSRLFDTRPDFNWDDIVDFEDFTVLANEWRTVTEGNPAVSISVDGDANNLSGEVGISVTGCPYSTSEVYIFMDGQLMGKSTYESDSIPGMIINTPSYANGSHSLKAVVCDFNNPFTVSANLAVDFNNPIYYLNIESAYEPNQPFQILGVNAADGNSIVKLSRWWNEEVVWSQQVSGELNIDIPGSVLEGQIYDISIEQEITTASSSSGSQQFESKSSSLPEIDWETIYKKGITAKYNPNELYKFAIFLPDAYYWETLSLFNTADCRRDAVAGIVNRCETMGIKYIILYRDQCTWENFSRVLTGPTSPSVIYAYVVSRGNIALPGEHVNNRTYFKISNGYVVSYLSPSEPLGGGWDGNPEVHSLASLGIGGNQFKLVWIDICYNGYNNDMAQSWMNLSGNPILNKLYVGWFNAVNTSNNSCYGQWSAFFWGYPDPDKGFGVTVDTRYQQAFDQVQNTQEGGLECVGNSILQNSLLGTKGDTSIRFSPNRYDYK